MDKKEILNLLFLKSERIRVVKDKKYENEFPDQSSYVEIDGQKTRYYKCSLCVGTKCLIKVGDRNTKDSLKKHSIIHGVNLFKIGDKRVSTMESGQSDQKKLKTSLSRFQISQLDSGGKKEFEEAIAIWQAKSDIPYNALANQEFNQILKAFAGKDLNKYHMFTKMLRCFESQYYPGVRVTMAMLLCI